MAMRRTNRWTTTAALILAILPVAGCGTAKPQHRDVLDCPRKLTDEWAVPRTALVEPVTRDEARAGLLNRTVLPDNSAEGRLQLEEWFDRVWPGFEAQAEPGDEIWFYRHLDPMIGWREGFVLIRDCTIVAEMTTRNDSAPIASRP